MCENVLTEYVKNTNKDREMLTTQGKNVGKVSECGVCVCVCVCVCVRVCENMRVRVRM